MVDKDRDVDSSFNPLLDDDSGDDFDLSSLDFDVSNLDSGEFDYGGKATLVDGSPLTDLDGFDTSNLDSGWGGDLDYHDNGAVGDDKFYAVDGHVDALLPDRSDVIVENDVDSLNDDYAGINDRNFDGYSDHDDTYGDNENFEEEFGEKLFEDDDFSESLINGSSGEDYGFVDDNLNVSVDDVEDDEGKDAGDSIVGDLEDEFSDDPLNEFIDDDNVSDSFSNIRPVVDDSDSDDTFDFWDDDEEDAPDPFGGYDIDEILGYGIDIGASDVHVSSNDFVAYTVLGDIVKSDKFDPIPATIVQRISLDIISNVSLSTFNTDLELDTSYVIRRGEYRGRRFRLSVGRSFNDVFMVFRIISNVIPDPDELGISGSLLGWADLPNGLVMVNGPTGHGKALTLDTHIPTPSGWTTMGDVKVGDVLYDSAMMPTVVEWLSEINYSPELYKIVFANGDEVFADSHHQWIVSDAVSRERMINSFVNDSFVDGNVVLDDGVVYSKKLLNYCSFYEGSLLDVNDLFKLFVDLVDGKEFLSYESFVKVVVSLDDSCLSFVDSDGSSVFFVDKVLLGVAEFLFNVFGRGGFVRTVSTLDLLDGFLSVDGVSGFSVPVVLDRCFEDGFWNEIVDVVRILPGDVGFGPVRCIGVDSPDHSYLCGNFVVTHNSTTLASIMRRIQLNRPAKIITIERPIEYIYGNDGKALITQREVGGGDTRTFANALTSAMRQAPDIIMIGEVRNQTEVSELLRAAETGHLAVSTMHTNSAAMTLNRIMSLYEGTSDQPRILSTLGDVARGFANQVLLKSPDGKSRYAVREVLDVNEEVADLIRAGNVQGIVNYQMKNEITMEHELVRAVKAGKVGYSSARDNATNLPRFEKLAKENGVFE